MAKPVGADAAQADNTVDLQNEIDDGLHHLEASIATVKASHGKTKRLEAGYQSVVKARDTAYRQQVPEYRAKALGKVVASLNKLIVEGQDAVNAANQGGQGGTAENSERLSKQIEQGLQELDKIAASLNIVHADTSDLLATRKALGDQSDGVRQIQDDGARGKALGQLAQRVEHGVETARAQLKGSEGAKPAVTDQEVAALDQAVQDLMKQLRDQTAKAKQSGMDVKQMESEQPELEKARSNALRLEGNAAKRKALNALLARLNGELRHAHALADAADGVMKGQKGPPTEEQKSKIYQAALEAGYNLKIKNDGNMKNTHLDQVFDMLGTVPPKDAMQGRLKQLKFDKKVDGGEYDESTNSIAMGDLDGGAEEYQMGGKVVKANSFNITTLHEIGHSVDTRHRIMKSHMSKPGCGGWEEITQDKIVGKLVSLMKQSSGTGQRRVRQGPGRSGAEHSGHQQERPAEIKNSRQGMGQNRAVVAKLRRARAGKAEPVGKDP